MQLHASTSRAPAHADAPPPPPGTHPPGGLGSLNWIKCSSGAAAVLDAGSSVADVLGAMGAAIAAGAGDAAAGAGAASVAVCSRTWSW